MNKAFLSSIASILTVVLVSTNPAVALAGSAMEAKRATLAPPSAFAEKQVRTDAPSPADKALMVVDRPLVSLVPSDFRKQIRCIQTITAHESGSPPMAVYKAFLSRSGFLTIRVFADLTDLQVIEDRGDRAGAAEKERLRNAKSSLRRLVQYLPGALKERETWEQVDPTTYRVNPERPDVKSTVAAALQDLGWQFAMVEGKARIKKGTDSRPVGLTPMVLGKPSEASVLPAALKEAARGITALVLGGSRPIAKPGEEFLEHRRRMFSAVVLRLFEKEKYAEAAGVLVLGLQDPGQSEEVYRIMHDELDTAFSALLLTKIPRETAAYLLASMNVVGEKSVLHRDASKPFTPQPDIDQGRIAWTAEVLGLVDQFTGRGPLAEWSIAPHIVRAMMVQADISFGPYVAGDLIRRLWSLEKEDPAHSLGDRSFLLAEQGFHPFKVLNSFDHAKRTGNVFPRRIPDVPQEKIVRAAIPLISNEEVVSYLMDRLYAGFGPDKNQAALKEVGQILFIKMNPLRAYLILKQMVLQTGENASRGRRDVYVGVLDEDLVHVLGRVPPEAAAQFLVEINHRANEEDVRGAFWGKSSVFQWTLQQLTQLYAHGGVGVPQDNPAVKVVRAMVSEEFGAQGGRELFRKILDPKTTHAVLPKSLPDSVGAVLDIYDALYEQMDDMVDWYTFKETGVLKASQLTPEQRDARVTQWAEDMLLLPGDWLNQNRALEHLGRLARLRDGRVIPALTAVVNRRYQQRPPEEWGMSTEEFDDFNAKFLRVAHDLDPEAFAQIFWTQEGAVPQMRRGLRAALRRLRDRLGPAPAWSGTDMGRLLLNHFSVEEQRDMVMRGAKLGAHERVAGFVEAGLMSGQLEAPVVAAGAFLESAPALRSLTPLVRRTHPRLADLYRSRSVLRSFDLSRTWKNLSTAHLYPFQGEYVDVEITLGTEAFRSFMQRFIQVFDYPGAAGSVERLEDMARVPVRLGGPVGDSFLRYVRAHPMAWQEILDRTQPGSSERQEAQREFLAGWKNSEPSEYIPILIAYLNTVGGQTAGDLVTAEGYVAAAFGQKPKETALALRGKEVEREELESALSQPPQLFLSEWRKNMADLMNIEGRSRFERFIIDPVLHGIALGEEFREKMEQVSAIIVAFATAGVMAPVIALLPTGYIVGMFLLLFVVLASFEDPILGVLASWFGKAQTIVKLVMAVFIWTVLLGMDAMHMLYHHGLRLPFLRRQLDSNLSSMQQIAGQIEFNPEVNLLDQLPSLLVEAASPEARRTIDFAFAADAEDLEILKSRLEKSSDPMHKIILRYAIDRRRLLTLQLPEAPATPALPAGPMGDVQDIAAFSASL